MNPDKPHSVLGELNEVISLSLPIIVTMGSHTLMQFVDTLMVGRYGENELAASVSGGLTFFIIGAFIIGVVGITNTFVSQSLGRGQLSECGIYTAHAVYVGLAAQVLILPLIAVAPSIFTFYGHDSRVAELEVTFFRALSFRLGGLGMVVAISGFFQGIGRPVIPMIAGIVANVLNIALDYGLIYGHGGLPRWGLLGSGIATTTATYLEALLLLGIYLRPAFNARYNTRRWRPFEWKKAWQILRIGAGSGVTFALDLASWTIFIAFFLGRLGRSVLAAQGAASELMHLSFMPAVGLNIGVTTLVGRYIGQGDIPAAKRRAYLGMACACAYMTAMGALFFIFRRPLIDLFAKAPDPEYTHAGVIIISYVALFQFSDAIGILSSGALRGAGDTKFPAIVQVITAWLFFLPLVYYLGKPEVWGLHGAWIGATIYIWIYDAVLFWRFVSERWRRINIFE